MIILPENTVKDWGECVTADDWFELSTTLALECTRAFLAGKITIADDWRVLSDVAMWRCQDIEARIERRLEAA